MSDLLYAGKTLSEVAGYTQWQRMGVIYLRRNKYGRLIRRNDDLPPEIGVDENGMRILTGKPISMETAFRRVNRKRGLSKQQIDAAWQKYKDDNPKMGKSHAPRTRRSR